MKPANNAPIYIGAYKELAEIARSHGYAMAVHGSVARDFDLVCIPWVEEAADPQTVVDEITTKFAFKETDKPARREHGRLVYTLSISFGDCFIDLSFMPRSAELAILRARLETVEADARGPFKIGDRVTKVRGSSWTGIVCGTYSTKLTPVGYAVESENEPGSVQIYPAEALRNLEPRHD